MRAIGFVLFLTSVLSAAALRAGVHQPSIRETASPNVEGAAGGVLEKLVADREDAFITVVSDSTAYTYGYLTKPTATRWAYLLAQMLGRRFPAFTVKYRQPAYEPGHPDLSAPASWDDWATIQKGTGTHTLWMSNASVPGAPSMYVAGANYGTLVLDTTPDLFIVAHGHNQGDDVDSIVPDIEVLTEPLAHSRPSTGILLVGQNPHADLAGERLMFERNILLEMLAETHRYGYVSVFRAFKEDPSNWVADLMADSIHPNAAGDVRWSEEIAKAFEGPPMAHPRTRSTLDVQAPQLAVNGRFRVWRNQDSAPDGWTVLNATVATDTTNRESGNAVRLTAVGDSHNGIAQQLASAEKLAGNWITVSARVFVARGQPATAGRVGIRVLDASGAAVCASDSNYFTEKFTYGQGAFRWSASQCYVGPGAKWASVFLWADTGSGHGVATFDRVSVTVGRNIHDNVAPTQ